MVCAKQNLTPAHRRKGSGLRTLHLLATLFLVQFPFLGVGMPNYDSFGDQTADGGSSYMIDSDLAGQTNAPNYRWNGIGTNFPPSKPIISAENLSYAGLPTSSGGSVAVTPTANADPTKGGGARLDLHYSSLGVVYYSLLLKVTDLSNVPTYNTNNTIVALNDDPREQSSAVARLGSRLLTKKSGDGYVLGIGRNNTVNEYQYDTTVHNIGEVVFVVASYELSGGVTNVNLWINPDSATFGTVTPPAPTVSADTFSSTAGNINANGPQALAIICQFGSAPSALVDEVRVGNTWAVVTGGLDFSLQPTNQSVVVGSNVTFSALAVGSSPISYVWQTNGVNLTEGGHYSGVTSRTLTISNVTHGEEATYSVVATSGANSVTSFGAYLTVTDPITDPLITEQPVSSTNVAGTTATFHVVATGTPTLSYQWLKAGDLLFDGGNISGAFTDTLSLSGVSSADEGSYSVVVINGLGASVTSSVVTLTVLSPVAITAQPTSRIVPQGGKTALAVGVSGTAVGYQWQLGGTDVSGATAAAYVLTNVQPAVTGNYRVIVTGPANAVTSEVASVSIATEPLVLASTNLVALRIGDGAEPLAAKGNPIFLDAFTPGGLKGTLSIPDSGPTSMLAIGPNLVALSGGAYSISGSGLTKSANGQYLVIGGYNTNLSNTGDLNASSASSVPRGIGLIDFKSQYTMVVSVTNAFNNTFYRGAVADGTNNYWGWGRSPGTYYFGYDAPATLVQGYWNNLRSMAIFNGNIYGVSAVSGKTGVMMLPGLPTVTNDIQVVIDTGRNSSSDCEVSPDGNLIYVADDSGVDSGGGVQRWQFDGLSWNLVYTLTDGLTSGARYVAVDFSGANPVVYAASSEADNNQIVRIEDTGVSSTGTVLGYAGANQTFRGLRLGPAEPAAAGAPTLTITPDSGSVILNWSGSYFLQSAPDVTGPYSDVINGTRPYTNSTTGETQQFFRLRQ